MLAQLDQENLRVFEDGEMKYDKDFPNLCRKCADKMLNEWGLRRNKRWKKVSWGFEASVQKR